MIKAGKIQNLLDNLGKRQRIAGHKKDIKLSAAQRPP